VVLILAIGLGLTVPMVSAGLMGNDFKAGLRRLQGILNEARYQAVIERKALALTVSFPERSGERAIYRLAPAQKKRAADQAGYRPLFRGDVRLAALQLGEQPPQSSGHARLRFLAQGLAEPATFHLVSDGNRYRVRLQAFSPRLIVQSETRAP
jgi:hypothetical protein